MKKLIMLETTDKQATLQDFHEWKLVMLDNKIRYIEQNMIGDEFKFVNLYLIDTDTEIKEGDIMLFDNIIIEKHFNWKDKSQCYKILSSTNNSAKLDLPQLSEQSIKLAIDYFNRTGKREVEVAIEEYESNALYNYGVKVSSYRRMKRNVEGKVDITIPEENDKTGEYFDLLKKFTKDFSLYRGIQILDSEILDWIELNLK